MRSRFILSAIALIVSTSLVACSGTESDSPLAPQSASVIESSSKPALENSIYDIAKSFSEDPVNPEFTILVAAIEAAGLEDVLDTKGMKTVFAPTDAAFAALFSNPEFPLTPAQLLANKELLTEVLLYHVAPGERFSDDVLSSDRIRMLNKSFTFVSVTGGGAFIVDNSDITTDAQLLAPALVDVAADNGVIHVIDQVLLP